MSKLTQFYTRIGFSAVSILMSAGNALAAEGDTNTLGGMFLNMISPLGSVAKDGLTWAYDYLAILLPVSAIFAMGVIYIKKCWSGGGGREKTHSEQASGEHQMEKVLSGFFAFIVFCVGIYLVWDKFLRAGTA